MDPKTWPIPLLLIGMFAIGSYRAATSGAVDGFALMAVSLVLSGVWVGTALAEKWRKHEDDQPL